MALERRYHPHWTSALYAIVTALLGIGALRGTNNLLFVLFGVAVTALIISGVLSGFMMMGLRPGRRAPSVGQVGEPFRIAYTLTSRNLLLPAFAIGLGEAPSKRRADKRWEDLFGIDTRGDVRTAFVVQIGARERLQASVVLTPTRRGVAELTGVRASSGFPFGLFRKSVTAPVRTRVRIRPAVRELVRGGLPAVSWHGTRRGALASRKGPGEEFFGLREYVPGDSPRFINWRASARSEGLVVREHASDATGRVRIALVLAPGAGTEDQERAIELAASVVSGYVRRGMEVLFEAPQSGVRISRVHAGTPAGLGRVLDALAEIDTSALGPSALEPAHEALVLVRTDEVSGVALPARADATLTSSDLDRLTARVGGSA